MGAGTNHVHVHLSRESLMLITDSSAVLLTPIKSERWGGGGDQSYGNMKRSVGFSYTMSRGGEIQKGGSRAGAVWEVSYRGAIC